MSSKMKFKDYTFDYNPEKLKIENKRNLVEIKLPLLGSVVQDMGISKKVISGSGEFFGANCAEKTILFKGLIDSNKSGMLVIPGFEPINAFLRSFTIVFDNSPESIAYSFEFWESSELNNENLLSSIKKYHTVEAGENLWTIAAIYNTTVSALMDLNPHIRRPDDLTVGQKVAVS